MLHLYQLARFDLLSRPREVLAIGLPILLALLVLWGSSRLGLWRAVLLLAPVAVTIPIALEARGRYQDGHCEYCQWKALTYLLPFLAIGVAAGSDRIWHAIRNRRGTWRLAAIVAGLVPLAGIAASSYANERLGKAIYESPAILSTDLRDVTGRVASLPAPRRVLIDAPDADNQSAFQLPATYNVLRHVPDVYISFDANGPAPSYLYPLYLPKPAYWTSTYDYVLTPFAGMETGRHVIEERGNFALERRRSIDVTLDRTGWILDTHQGSKAIPWIQAPFRISVASPKAQRITLRVKLDRPLHDRATLAFATLNGHSLSVVPSADGASLCIPVQASKGRTEVAVTPRFDAVPPPAIRITESDPLPSPRRALGLAGLRAEAAPCPAAWLGNVAPAIAYGHGWFPPEVDPGSGTFRWMKTDGAMDVGRANARHPAVTLQSTIWSLTVPRTVTISIAGRVVKTVQAAPDAVHPFAIRIPAGFGRVRVTLHADPPAASATSVSPSDHRHVSVRIRAFDVLAS